MSLKSSKASAENGGGATGGRRLEARAADQPVAPAAGVPENVKGVVVTGIDDDSPLAALDLQPGDVIEAINQRPVASPEEAIADLKEAAASGRRTCCC